MSCGRADDYLSQRGVTVRETVDARKQSILKKEALKIVRGAKKIIVAKGKQVREADPSALDDGELEALVIGPTGALRAPTLRLGDVYYIGFNPDAYASRFGR